MKVLSADTANDLYRQACHELVNEPEHQAFSKLGELNEISNAALVLSDPRNNIVTMSERKLSMKYLAGETAFYLAESDSLEFIAYYSKFWRGISDDNRRVNSCYGRRLFKESAKGETQIGYVIKQLLKSKDTKKAVAMIYKERDTNFKTKDNPCTMYLHFAIRNNRLNLTVHMRSNDVWFGLPYDIFFFTTVQQIVLAHVNEVYGDIRLGEYTHMANSLHLYDKDAKKAVACANAILYDDGRSPAILKHDLAAIRSYLYFEELMRTTPEAIPMYDKALAESKFFSLMLSFLKGDRNA